MDPRCRIELLGGLRVEQGERVITRFRTQKTGALLGYLAYYGDRTHPREVLIELLWPERAPAAGRHSLRMALTSLRHQLEPPGIPAGAVILADRLSVQLNPDAVVTDVADFEAAQSAAADAASDTERARALLEAADLYGGELLSGYYEDWILPEQRRLAELHFRSLHWLTAYLEQAGEWDRALDCARRAVAADPLREEAHQDFIRLLAVTGQPPAALDQYEQLKSVLREELNGAPSAATRELAHRIELQQTSTESPGPPLTVPVLQPTVPSLLPTGTVTFLLTDIEGARSLTESSGEVFQEALEEHDAVLGRTFEAHGGREVKHTDTSFTVAFAHPSDALACAIACQRELAAHSWPEGTGALRVRMGLHTREVKPREDERSGWLLGLATGVLLAAHGGQILCSEPAAALLRRHLKAGARLTDLGYYRLRGEEDPERLLAVEYPGMAPKAFPPPTATPAYTSNLPLQLTTFFGREEELSRLEELLLEEERRLVTLTGPGGSGKTRLALEVAGHLSETFRGAVWLVEHQELTDPQRILPAVLEALRLPRIANVEPLDQAVAALSLQPSLLVLDNFEHMVEGGAPVVRALLERVPTLTCLVTSRRVVELTAERRFLVAPLPTPTGDESPEGLMRFASVQLFVDRAQAVRPDFQVTEHNAKSIAELCSGLEGIPLALELAAARVQTMTPAKMVASLEHRFDFLVTRKRDVEHRHRTLRAAMEWSYRLLTPELQRFFTQLSVFRGGWTVEASEAVCEEARAFDYLEELRQSSLISADEGAQGMRFRMLETLREYAREQLTPADETAIGRRHAQYYLALAEEAEPELDGPEQVAWLDRLETEHDNMRAALAWFKSAEDGAEGGLQLAGTLAWFWEVRGYMTEGRVHLGELLARKEAAAHTAARAKALRAAARLARHQGDNTASQGLYEESLAIARELGDKREIAISLEGLSQVALWHRGEKATAASLLEESEAIWRELGGRSGIPEDCSAGWLANFGGDQGRARALFEEALADRRERGDKRGMAAALDGLRQVAGAQGDRATVRALTEELSAIHRELGDRDGIANALLNLGAMAGKEGDYARARALCEECLAIFRQLGTKQYVGYAVASLANVLRCMGDLAAARALCEEHLAISRERGDKDAVAGSLSLLGHTAVAEGDWARARSLFEESLPVLRERQKKDVSWRNPFNAALSGLAYVAIHEGEYAEGRALCEERLAIWGEPERPMWIRGCLDGFANLCRAQGQPERAARLFGAAEALGEALNVPTRLDRRYTYDRDVAAVRAALDEETFAAAWAAGRAMTQDEAVAFALEEDSD